MEELPDHILFHIAEDDRAIVQRWWCCLTSAQRSALLAAWDARQEEGHFAPQDGDTWEERPVVIGGRFVPAEESELIGTEWRNDYFEYLLKNPELLLPEVSRYRRFLGCTAHPEARAVLERGCIPAGFQCPLQADSCPMLLLLAQKPNQSIQLGNVNDLTCGPVTKVGIECPIQTDAPS